MYTEPFQAADGFVTYVPDAISIGCSSIALPSGSSRRAMIRCTSSTSLTYRARKPSGPAVRSGYVCAGAEQEIGASGAIYRGNFQLVRNLIDWAVADTDLLQIRGSGAFARTLMPLSEAEKTRWELTNYLVVLIALAVVVGIAATTRRRTRPLLARGATGTDAGAGS